MTTQVKSFGFVRFTAKVFTSFCTFLRGRMREKVCLLCVSVLIFVNKRYVYSVHLLFLFSLFADETYPPPHLFSPTLLQLIIQNDNNIIRMYTHTYFSYKFNCVYLQSVCLYIKNDYLLSSTFPFLPSIHRENLNMQESLTISAGTCLV